MGIHLEWELGFERGYKNHASGFVVVYLSRLLACIFTRHRQSLRYRSSSKATILTAAPIPSLLRGVIVHISPPSFPSGRAGSLDMKTRLCTLNYQSTQERMWLLIDVNSLLAASAVILTSNNLSEDTLESPAHRRSSSTSLGPRA